MGSWHCAERWKASITCLSHLLGVSWACPWKTSEQTKEPELQYHLQQKLHCANSCRRSSLASCASAVRKRLQTWQVVHITHLLTSRTAAWETCFLENSFCPAHPAWRKSWQNHLFMWCTTCPRGENWLFTLSAMSVGKVDKIDWFFGKSGRKCWRQNSPSVLLRGTCQSRNWTGPNVLQWQRPAGAPCTWKTGGSCHRAQASGAQAADGPKSLWNGTFATNFRRQWAHASQPRVLAIKHWIWWAQDAWKLRSYDMNGFSVVQWTCWLNSC